MGLMKTFFSQTRKLEGALMDVRRRTGSGTDENDRAYYCRLLDRVLRGEEEAKVYTGKPVWDPAELGF